MSVILLTIILALLVAYIIHKWKQASKWDHFPGLTKYTSLPMIGHAYMLSKNPSRELRDLTKKYGTIYRFDIGSVPTIILTEYEDIVAAYKQDVFSGRIFHSLDGFQNLKALDTHGESPGLATAYGSTWRDNRKFILSQFNDLGMTRNSVMEDIIAQEVQSSMEMLHQKVQDQPGKPLHMEGRFMPAMNNIIWRFITGRQSKQTDPEVQELSRITSEMFLMFDPSHFSGLLQLNFRYASHICKMLGLNNLLDIGGPLTEQLWKDIANGSPDEHGTYIDRHLAKLEKSKDNPNSVFYGLKGIQQLHGIVFDFFSAGTDTSATFLEWSILYLCKYPAIQEKVHAELKEKLGDRAASLADRPLTPYTECFMEEVMRSCHMVDMVVPHAVEQDTTFKGYHFPKGTAVFAVFDYVHSDPKYWSEPDAFKPERFLVDGKFKSDERVCFFGIGKRRCVGEMLGRANQYLFLASLIQNFKFSMPPGKKPVFDYRAGLIFYPLPYDVICESRLQA